jgi:uncharacterized membrane protein
MDSNRSDILDWTEQGRIAPERLRAALEAGGALPSAGDWRRFLDALLLWLGAIMLASAVIFFFAYNWNEMGRLAKIGLLEALIAVALLILWRLELASIAGKAALFSAALLVGGLFALIGQIYQTGADPWELFAVWAAAILPWALLGRLPALWLLWLTLLNLAFALYFLTFGLTAWGVLFAPETMLWLLFGLNTVALIAWEGAIVAGVAWLNERWAARVVATASGAAVVALAIYAITGWHKAGGWGLMAWLTWICAAYAFYRYRQRDLFVLAAGVLSVIVVVTTLVVDKMRFNDAGGFLFIAMLVIGLSAAGGYWLKGVAREGETREGV